MAVAGPMRARAQSADFDAIDQADVLQKQALKAAREKNWTLARSLAEEVLTLDVSFATAPSRLVLARALQQEENYPGALYELRQLEQLDGVADKIVEEVAELRAETEALQARAERLAARPEGGDDRNAGIGLLVGGAAPLVLGGLFVGTDINHAAQQEESGTWAVIGGPILATGVILEVVGAGLLARSRRSARAASLSSAEPWLAQVRRPVPLRVDGLSFGVDGDRFWLGLSGSF